MTDWLDTLHGYLDKRAMPESVAKVLFSRVRTYDTREGALLATAVHARQPWWVTSMSEDYQRPPDCSRPLAAVGAVFGADVTGLDAADTGRMRDIVSVFGAGLGWHLGADWKCDRLSRAQRAGLGDPDFPAKRQYNRRVRVLRNLERHAEAMSAAQARRRLILISRSGFACDITLARFRADPEAAAFISWYAARKNKRRLFSLGGRENPFDQIAEMLLARCKPGTDWEMIAWVYPDPVILARLSDEQRGRLMASWRAVMSDTAGQLASVWATLGTVNRSTMIVRRGMDSSSWNELAGAYNASRAAWISCLAASGALQLLDAECPGKVMRLMAADLAWWHQASGGEVDPNTAVWAALPLPWDVLDEKADCNPHHIADACKEAGLDPEASGWLAPRAKGAVAQFRPTPELVHGVEIADPAWAALLRRAGVFSAKGIRQEMAAEALTGLKSGVVTGPLPDRRLMH